MSTILVIDDDDDLLKLIQNILAEKNTIITRNSVIGISQTELNQADLIILDVMMPQIDGFQFLRTHRQFIDAPVLFLTAKDFEQDKLEGFASGADDYITKPFSIQELRARVAANLRREQRNKHTRLSDSPVTCDLIQRQFYVQQQLITLTASEYDICLFLLQHAHQVFSREDIYTAVYGYDASGDSKFTITERIKKIRDKFNKAHVSPIQTVWGIGYKWEINL